VDDDGKLLGVVNARTTRLLATQANDASWALAADVMLPPIALHEGDDLRFASKLFLDNGLRELPVIDDCGRIIGFLDEHEIAGVYLSAETRADAASSTSLPPVVPSQRHADSP
jgi:CBS domain-containing protein